MDKVNETSSRVRGAYGCGIISHSTGFGDYTTGSVVTRVGMVDVYIQEDHYRMDFVLRGKHHIRTVHKPITKTGIVRVANKWAQGLSRKPEGGTK